MRRNLDSVFIAARKHLGGQMESSARLCLEDSMKLLNEGDKQAAAERALKSLAYSVGIMSSVYQKARAHVYWAPINR